MSEKQAKRNRKVEPKKAETKKSGSVWANVIITVIIVAFLGLACYALKDSIKSMIPEKPEKTPTVADMAKERDMTVEEFMTEFGLDGSQITKDSTEADLVSVFTVANYAKFQDKTSEELMAEYGIEGISDDMLWQDAFGYIPMSNYAQMLGVTFDELKEQSNFPETITAETTLGEAQQIMQETPAETEEEAEEPVEEEAE